MDKKTIIDSFISNMNNLYGKLALFENNIVKKINDTVESENDLKVPVKSHQIKELNKLQPITLDDDSGDGDGGNDGGDGGGGGGQDPNNPGTHIIQTGKRKPQKPPQTPPSPSKDTISTDDGGSDPSNPTKDDQDNGSGQPGDGEGEDSSESGSGSGGSGEEEGSNGQPGDEEGDGGSGSGGDEDGSGSQPGDEEGDGGSGGDQPGTPTQNQQQTNQQQDDFFKKLEEIARNRQETHYTEAERPSSEDLRKMEEYSEDLRRRLKEAQQNRDEEGSSGGGAGTGLDIYKKKITIGKSEIAWKEKLLKLLESMGFKKKTKSYTYKKPSRTAYGAKSVTSTKTGQPIGITPTTMNKVLITVDSSGSITNKDFVKFVTEMLAIVQTFEDLTAYIMFWSGGVLVDSGAFKKGYIKIDTSNLGNIQQSFERLKSDVSNRQISGGTDFDCIKDWVLAHPEILSNLKVCVHFTDGGLLHPLSEKDKIASRITDIFVLTPDGSDNLVKSMPKSIIYKFAEYVAKTSYEDI